ncbi:MAG: type II secretion system protein GspL [Candidatus Competibacteraceae bacterium]|jgi:general secretion pathway protein L|nr:type II secretion system protein GspL [Candidatus Competibacteraceae bacterium]
MSTDQLLPINQDQRTLNQWIIARFIDTERFEWLVGERLAQGSLSEMAQPASGKRLVLIAPGETVLLIRATLPERNRSQWLKALPYALEDHVADEVEELHFAVGSTRSGEAPVAAIRHATLSNWLDQCTRVGLIPTAVVPEPLLLPFEPASWSVLLKSRRAVVRCGPDAGFTTEQDNLLPLLELALAEAGETAPTALRLWGEAVPELATSPEIQHQGDVAEPLRLLAAGYQDGVTLNLLQGSYSRHAQWGKWLRPWRVAAVLAGLWLGLQGILQVGEYWQLRNERVALQAEMERVFRETVPTARRIVNPKAQLENRLRELQGGPAVEETGFLELLLQGGQVLTGFEDVRLRGLRYKIGQLDMELAGDSLETLDRLRQRLTEQAGLTAQMRTTKREDRIESRVTLKKAAL